MIFEFISKFHAASLITTAFMTSFLPFRFFGLLFIELNFIIKIERLSNPQRNPLEEIDEDYIYPGKENRINVEIELKKEDSKKIEVSKNSDESSKPKEKANDSKSVKSSRIDSRKDKKRPNTSKTSETQAKRRKRIQVIRLYYNFIQRMFYGVSILCMH